MANNLIRDYLDFKTVFRLKNYIRFTKFQKQKNINMITC